MNAEEWKEEVKIDSLEPRAIEIVKFRRKNKQLDLVNLSFATINFGTSSIRKVFLNCIK